MKLIVKDPWMRGVLAKTLLIAAVVSAFLYSRVSTSVGAAVGPVEVIRTPEGGIQPQAVRDSKGDLHLISYRGDPSAGDLFYQRQLAANGRWTSPIRVNTKPSSAVAMGTIRGGQISLGKNNRPHVVWFGSSKSSAGNHGMGAPLLYSRLNDAGTAFEPQRDLMQGTQQLDGGASIAADKKGNVYLAWRANAAGEKQEAKRLLLDRHFSGRRQNVFRPKVRMESADGRMRLLLDEGVRGQQGRYLCPLSLRDSAGEPGHVPSHLTGSGPTVHRAKARSLEDQCLPHEQRVPH